MFTIFEQPQFVNVRILGRVFAFVPLVGILMPILGMIELACMLVRRLTVVVRFLNRAPV